MTFIEEVSFLVVDRFGNVIQISAIGHEALSPAGPLLLRGSAGYQPED